MTTSATSALSNRVDSPSPAHQRMQAKRERCRHVYDGIDAIVEHAEEYFPKLEDEETPDLEKRVRLAALHPGLEQTVGATVGTILSDGPGFETDMPKPLVDFAENVDGGGTHLAVFSNTLLTDAMVDAFAGIIVEHSTLPNPEKSYSPDELRRLGHGPYWIAVRAEDVIKQVYATINGKQVLVLLVVREKLEELDGDFGIKAVTQYRAYRRVRDANGDFTNAIDAVEYRADGAGDPVEVENSMRTLRKMARIPWAPLATGRTVSLVETYPALLTLADIVLQYHRTLTSILNMQYQALNAPTLVMLGRSADPTKRAKVKLGPKQVIDAPPADKVGTDKPVYWLQLDTKACEPSEKSLDRAETMMGVAFGSFLGLQPAGVESAKAKMIREKGGNATLAKAARATKDCLELAFSFTGEYMGLTSGRVNVRTDFTDMLMEAPVMMAYIELKKSGFPTMPVLIALQKSGRIPPDQNLQQLADDWDAMSDAMDQAKAEADALKNAPPTTGAAA